MNKKKIPAVPLPNNPVNTVQVEDGAIKAISPSFSILGGESHKKGGTTVQFGNTIVEAQKGEPLSMDDKGNVIAWGKLKNPLTGRIFETDAKEMAKSELQTVKKLDKGIDMVNTSDYTKPVGSFSFGTGKVLTDAAIIEQEGINAQKQEYANAQQTILDFSEAFGIKSEKLANQLAKNGATLTKGSMKVKITGVPKAQNGQTVNPYMYPEDYYPQLMNMDRAGNTPQQQSTQPQPITQNNTEMQSSDPGTTGNGWTGAINKVGSFAVDAINAVGSIRRDIMVAAPQILNSMIPDIHNDRERAVQRTYNQYAYGTGSKMMYDKGGKIAQNGSTIYRNPNRQVTYVEPDARIYTPEMEQQILNGQFIIPSGVTGADQITTTQPQNGSVYGSPVPLADFSSFWGRDWSGDIRGFQNWYNEGVNTFNTRFPDYAIPTDVGFSDAGFRRADNAYGNYTSSRGKPVVPLQMTSEQLAQLRQSGAITQDPNGRDLVDPARLQGLGIEGAYTEGIHLYTPQAPIEQIPINVTGADYIRQEAAIPTATPLTEQDRQRAINAVNEQPVNPQEPQRLPSLADRNRLGLANILPELVAMFDQPSFVPRQEFTPELYSPYQVSFQDRVNQNMSVFNQQAQMLRDEPAALSTLAAQARQANDAVLAEEFRVNQGISNQVYNQNLGILNQAQLQNMQLADQQFMRQEQARENTRNTKRAALQSMSAKVLQNRAENTAIRMIENLSNYRMNDDYIIENYNADPEFRWSRTGQSYKEIDKSKLTEEQKQQLYQEALQFSMQKQRGSNDQIKRLGGSFLRRF